MIPTTARAARQVRQERLAPAVLRRPATSRARRAVRRTRPGSPRPPAPRACPASARRALRAAAVAPEAGPATPRRRPPAIAPSPPAFAVPRPAPATVVRASCCQGRPRRCSWLGGRAVTARHMSAYPVPGTGPVRTALVSFTSSVCHRNSNRRELRGTAPVMARVFVRPNARPTTWLKPKITASTVTEQDMTFGFRTVRCAAGSVPERCRPAGREGPSARPCAGEQRPAVCGRGEDRLQNIPRSSVAAGGKPHLHQVRGEGLAAALIGRQVTDCQSSR